MINTPYTGVDQLGRVIPSPALLRAYARDAMDMPEYWNKFRTRANDSALDEDAELDAIYASMFGRLLGTVATRAEFTDGRARTRTRRIPARDQRDVNEELDQRYAALFGKPMLSMKPSWGYR
jgi:hypothetical protein